MSVSERYANLRAQMALQEEEKKNRESNSSGYYPFTKMDFDKEAIVRFIPDANPTNPYGFMVEKRTHNLTINGKEVNVPCLKMYNPKAACPICELSQQFYKKEGKDSENGRKYYVKRSYIARALVVSDPLPVEQGKESNEGKIKVVNMTKQVSDKILSALNSSTDPLPEMPDDFDNGFNFIIRKRKQGDGHAHYNDSGFARSSTPTPAAAREQDLVDLRTLLPKEPTFEKVEAMLKSDLTGEAYDDGSFAYKRQQTGGADAMTALLNRKLNETQQAASESAPTPPAKSSTVEDTPASSANPVPEAASEDDDPLLRQIKERAAKRRASQA